MLLVLICVRDTYKYICVCIRTYCVKNIETWSWWKTNLTYCQKSELLSISNCLVPLACAPRGFRQNEWTYEGWPQPISRIRFQLNLELLWRCSHTCCGDFNIVASKNDMFRSSWFSQNQLTTYEKIYWLHRKKPPEISHVQRRNSSCMKQIALQNLVIHAELLCELWSFLKQ